LKVALDVGLFEGFDFAGEYVLDPEIFAPKLFDRFGDKPQSQQRRFGATVKGCQSD
jgi:hypothetical protein